MYLADRKCVVFDIPDTTKEEVINILIDKLVAIDAISDKEEFYQNVIDREKHCATAIDNEIGIPHGKTSNVLKPSICFGRLIKPIIWDKETGKKVKYVILIAVPLENHFDIHMKMISSLARKLMHSEYRSILLNGSKEDVFEFFNTIIEI